MPVLKELKETKVFKVQLDQPEMLALKGLKVVLVTKVIKDQRAMLL
jgi:hypothetical protein